MSAASMLKKELLRSSGEEEVDFDAQMDGVSADGTEFSTGEDECLSRSFAKIDQSLFDFSRSCHLCNELSKFLMIL